MKGRKRTKNIGEKKMKWITTDWKGIALGIAFMVLGILVIAYAGLALSGPGDISFGRLIGFLNFLAGTVQILYIGYKRRRARHSLGNTSLTV